MKIAILNESKQGIGGGWSFIANLTKGLKEIGVFLSAPDEADIVLIPSATMTSRDRVNELKAKGKKIVLRLDNIPRNSRNRGAGTTRLFDIAQVADKVIYQSRWAKEYLQPFLKRDGTIIYNGIDTNIFKPEGAAKDFVHTRNLYPVYLYSRFNRDETKGWERAWYDFQMIARQNPRAKLIIVGQFSDELKAYNFDFYNKEIIEYFGVVNTPEEMAKVYRGCHVLLAPYFNDCYSNTIQEAIACGLDIRAELSGGTPELLHNGVIDLKTMAQKYMEELA
jgi:glycosyltransferase involved in cell wall biosynthesis